MSILTLLTSTKYPISTETLFVPLVALGVCRGEGADLPPVLGRVGPEGQRLGAARFLQIHKNNSVSGSNSCKMPKNGKGIGIAISQESESSLR